MNSPIVPVECKLALSPEEVDMILEDEFENKIFLNVVGRSVGSTNVVAQKRQTGQRKVILKKRKSLFTKQFVHCKCPIYGDQ